MSMPTHQRIEVAVSLTNDPTRGIKPPTDLREELQKLVFTDGAWILPLIQGGKGVGATNGKNAGAWARENTGGTIAATGAAIGYGENGREVSYTYTGRARHQRHEEMIALSTRGCILQAKIAHEAAQGKGPLPIEDDGADHGLSP